MNYTLEWFCGHVKLILKIFFNRTCLIRSKITVLYTNRLIQYGYANTKSRKNWTLY